MPADFEACVKKGGKVITKTLGKGKYMHLCKDSDGNWHKGETKTKKASGQKFSKATVEGLHKRLNAA